jgi:hypothetical protein
VGATQDLAALDIDLAPITQAGGWKSTRRGLEWRGQRRRPGGTLQATAKQAGQNRELIGLGMVLSTAGTAKLTIIKSVRYSSSSSGCNVAMRPITKGIQAESKDGVLRAHIPKVKTEKSEPLAIEVH